MRLLTTRFWEKVRKTRKCWIWIGNKTNGGYGHISRGRRGEGMARAHVLSWIWSHGAVPPGLCVLHKCDNPACVNPDHLYVGTHRQNAIDKITRRRALKNHAYVWARLTARQVRELRLSKEPFDVLAARYGVSPSHISKLRAGHVWKHVAAQLVTKIRWVRASNKLTPRQVEQVRRAEGTHQEIADRFGIGQPHVTRIKGGKRWAHLNDQHGQ